jgi:tripartite-type tricarboxylate transporter receptor subunit TctC
MLDPVQPQRRRTMSKRPFVAALAGAALLLSLAASAQTWPDRPVRVVVPAPAGSSLDIVVRTLGEKLKERWKHPLVVDNKPGAGGMLGMDVVAKAAPDGYTLGIGFNGPIAFGPFLYKKMPYDPAKDLAPIVLTTSQPNVLAVQAGNPAKTLPEFIAWAKAQGDRLSYASVGNGSSSHLTAELFDIDAGIKAVHVPYNGSPPAATSVAAGETQMLFAVAPALIPFVQSGKVRLLAVTSKERLPSMKDVPTIAEQGFPGFEALAWNGLFAPAGTPAEIVNRINADVNELLRLPEVRDAFARQGLVVGGGSAAEFKAMIERDAKKWGAIITKTGIKLD